MEDNGVAKQWNTYISIQRKQKNIYSQKLRFTVLFSSHSVGTREQCLWRSSNLAPSQLVDKRRQQNSWNVLRKKEIT